MAKNERAEPVQFLAHDRAEWRAWLAENHRTATGVWLVFYKKGSGKPHLSYDEAVEEALCFGWIDSKPGKLDDERSMQYYSPRKPKSNWSKINKERVERLMAAGLMTESGLKMVELAKRTGTWAALDEVEALIVPPDLQTELEALQPAATHFAAFPRSVKRGILEWIMNAKTPETRQKRIAETVRLAAENIRANQYVKK
ncbi:MAG: YdeI/OmpD-associated family protein [Saprospiraceae bacterium]